MTREEAIEYWELLNLQSPPSASKGRIKKWIG